MSGVIDTIALDCSRCNVFICSISCWLFTYIYIYMLMKVSESVVIGLSHLLPASSMQTQQGQHQQMPVSYQHEGNALRYPIGITGNEYFTFVNIFALFLE